MMLENEEEKKKNTVTAHTDLIHFFYTQNYIINQKNCRKHFFSKIPVFAAFYSAFQISDFSYFNEGEEMRNLKVMLGKLG